MGYFPTPTVKSVPIPGEILKTTVVAGLTFEEVIVLATVPLVTVFPALFIKEIPLTITLGLIVVMAVLLLIVIARTPEGQTPLEWAPAAAQRRFNPDVYEIKPKTAPRSRPTYLNRVHTAEQVKEEADAEDVDIDSAATDIAAVGHSEGRGDGRSDADQTTGDE